MPKQPHPTTPTPQLPEQDYFYYVTDEDKEEVLEVLGYNQRQQGEEERIGKYW